MDDLVFAVKYTSNKIIFKEKEKKKTKYIDVIK